MHSEVYMHKDVGTLNISEIWKNLASMDVVKLGQLSVKGFMTAGGHHDYDEPRLARLRRSGLGLYNPILVMWQEPDPKTAQLDIIDGWHRVQVLYELDVKEVFAFIIPIAELQPYVLRDVIAIPAPLSSVMS